MKPFHFITLKYKDFWGKRKNQRRKNQKSLFKSVENISVLNVAFSKSVLVLIKKWVYVRISGKKNIGEVSAPIDGTVSNKTKFP